MYKMLALTAVAIATLGMTGCGSDGKSGSRNQDTENEQSAPSTMAEFENAPYTAIDWYVEGDRSTDLTIERISGGAGYPHRIFVRRFDGIQFGNGRTLFVDQATHPEIYAQLEAMFEGTTPISVYTNPEDIDNPLTVLEFFPADETLETKVIRPDMAGNELQYLRDFVLHLLETE